MIELELLKHTELVATTYHETKDEAWKFISVNAKGADLGYYYRQWEDDGWTMVDFGSHVYFFRYRTMEEKE